MRSALTGLVRQTYSVRITGPSQTDSIDCPTYSYGVVIDGKEVVNRFARAGRGGKVEVRGYKTPDGVKAFKFSEPVSTAFSCEGRLREWVTTS